MRMTYSRVETMQSDHPNANPRRNHDQSRGRRPRDAFRGYAFTGISTQGAYAQFGARLWPTACRVASTCLWPCVISNGTLREPAARRRVANHCPPPQVAFKTRFERASHPFGHRSGNSPFDLWQKKSLGFDPLTEFFVLVRTHWRMGCPPGLRQSLIKGSAFAPCT